MTAKEILEELKPLGTESYKRVMLKHGVKEPFFGVKISDLHRIVKRIKKITNSRSTSPLPTACLVPGTMDFSVHPPRKYSIQGSGPGLIGFTKVFVPA